MCDRALIINDGQVFKDGSPREIINDPAVRNAYLGHTFRGDEFDDNNADGQEKKSAPLADKPAGRIDEHRLSAAKERTPPGR